MWMLSKYSIVLKQVSGQEAHHVACARQKWFVVETLINLKASLVDPTQVIVAQIFSNQDFL